MNGKATVASARLVAGDSRNLAGAFLFLNHADDGSFIVEHILTFVLTTNVGFVDLNYARERIVALLHHEPDLFGHAPGGFVGDTQVSLDLFGADAVLAHAKEIDDIEPFSERGFGLMEDGVG